MSCTNMINVADNARSHKRWFK